MANFSIQARELQVDPDQLQSSLQVSAPMARILSARGVDSETEIDYRLNLLDQPDGIPDIERAASRIADAIEQEERILICGDYDADGATASALCTLFFRSIGYENADYRVPNRFNFGYGLTTSFVESILDDEPDLLITVDNGVSSYDGVALANENDIDVIVTDHHLVAANEDDLPAAHSIVNPNLPSSTFVSEPSGVGVAFYQLASVRAELMRRGYFEDFDMDPPDMRQWLDLVAVGSIADMVPLDLNNRRLVSGGLQRMRYGELRPGFLAICDITRTSIDTLTTSDIGFRVAPRINAAGRLDDISIGIQLMVTEDWDEAQELAATLHDINRQRREIQRSMNDTALGMLELVDVEQKKSCCVYHREFHQGVVGLVAGRLAERLHAPTIVFADAEEDPKSQLRGSARTIPGIHIRDVLAYVDQQYPNLMLSYGGHAGAAGLAIPREQFDRFSAVFDDAVQELAEEDAFNPSVITDGELSDDEASLELTDEIADLEPWGQGFSRPIFHGEFDVVARRLVGRDREHQKFILRQDRRKFDAIAFSKPMVDAKRIRMVYELSPNEYRGRVSLQLIASKIEAVD